MQTPLLVLLALITLVTLPLRYVVSTKTKIAYIPVTTQSA